MAYVLIRSEERQQAENEVLRSFRADPSNAQSKEYAECIAARTQEALRNMEEKNR